VFNPGAGLFRSDPSPQKQHRPRHNAKYTSLAHVNLLDRSEVRPAISVKNKNNKAGGFWCFYSVAGPFLAACKCKVGAIASPVLQYRSVKISARFFSGRLQSGRDIFQTVDGGATINRGTMYANRELFRTNPFDTHHKLQGRRGVSSPHVGKPPHALFVVINITAREHRNRVREMPVNSFRSGSYSTDGSTPGKMRRAGLISHAPPPFLSCFDALTAINPADL
jgi:hypothetical protein